MAAAVEMEFRLDSLYWMGVMQLHHERRRLAPGVFDEMLRRTLAELAMDRDAFLEFVESHREDLQRTVDAAGF
jgi:hypothetical protein